MRNYPRTLKRKILDTISQLREELPRYTQDSRRDFTRKRKLPFAVLCRTILSMSGQSLHVELQRQFHYIEQKGWNYLIRVKEKQGILSGLNLPDAPEFSV